ncbi:MAG TPA: M20 aminoacylase family protein [Nevskiaceae bacterium]
MSVDPVIAGLGGDMAAWRHDIHRHPEVGFKEHRTADKVAGLLREFGVEVHAGFGGTTAVIGTLRGARQGTLTVGLRADMDALPLQEKSDAVYRSVNEGVAHSCGHDGHTSMLLGTARYLAEHRDFAGTVRFIFQPAEETLRGGAELVRHGLFEEFPCDEIYALHNANVVPFGKVGVYNGALLAANDLFRIRIRGVGSHGAEPQRAVDPVMIGAQLVQGLQTVVSRNVDPARRAVLSVCQFHAGTAINVIPESAELEGTIRTMDKDVQRLVLERVQTICRGTAATYGCEIEFEHLLSAPATFNHAEQTEVVRQAAGRVVGPENVVVAPQLMNSEDFAAMLEQRPGSYFLLGHDGLTCHNPAFDFDDRLLPVGVEVFVEIVRQRLA